MCARFNLMSTEKAARYFQGRLRFDEPVKYNIAPTDMILTVLEEHGLTANHMRWGMHLGPSRGAVINLRSEGQSLERSFGKTSHFRRCLVPATGFFEWREEGGAKQPYNFVLASGEAFALAGLCQQRGEEPAEFAILTCEPNELVADYHDRMPSVVASEDADGYLAGDPEAVAKIARIPFPAELMAVFPVTRKMSNSRFQGEEAVRHIEPQNRNLFDGP